MLADVQLIIFDCDGVLIDSEVLSMRMWQQVLKERGANLTPAYFVDEFLGKSVQIVEQCVARDFGITLTADDLARFHHRLVASFAAHLKPTEGIVSLLQQLSVPYCLATSSSSERTSQALSCTSLAPYFPQHRFTRSQVTRGKPAPDLFLYAAEAMGAAPANCLVIEDSPAGLEAAHAAGMQVLRFTGGSHLQYLDDLNGTSISSWQAFKTRFPELLKNIDMKDTE
ncbi:HAD family hydrolase [Alteromonas sp. C1M14]|uniref:HAD family hydrolase n=1 Tax=Alteromonas sp. C1M14 TaxID=2841567 RepID=UPI001C08E8B5|nr:HAD family hydrolase [Alteromonas sp. C1M14]